MAENISPEEKLFKIIQDGKKNPPAVKAPADAGGRGKAGWVKRFFAGPKKPKQAPAVAGNAAAIFASPINLREEDIRTVNKILAVVCIAVTALVFYYLINRRPNVADITGRPYDAPFPRRSKETMQAFKPLSFYMGSVKKRDIFRPPPEKKAVKASEEVKKETVNELKQITGGLKLQGISWGASPKAMIKDESDGQVYFLKAGETIGTSKVKVKTILKDKVTVSYKEEEMEL